MPKGVPNKQYTPEFKTLLIETMRKEQLGYMETADGFKLHNQGRNGYKRVQQWERIYLEEGPEGFHKERRWETEAVAPRCGGRSAGRSSAPSCGECLPKKLASLGFGRRATPAQKALVIQKLRQDFKFELLLSIAQLPRATYYYHVKQQTTADKYSAVKETITAIYLEHKGRYGYRRITDELHAREFTLNHKTVQRLMKQLGLICMVRVKKYRSSFDAYHEAGGLRDMIERYKASLVCSRVNCCICRSFIRWNNLSPS